MSVSGPVSGRASSPGAPQEDRLRGSLFAELGAASHALSSLVDGCGPDVARTLLRLVTVIAGEAAASERFATALAQAIGPLADGLRGNARSDDNGSSESEVRVPGAPGSDAERPPTRATTATAAAFAPRPVRRTSSRRPPGPFDPYEVYAAGGMDDLRARLAGLGVEELKDVITEHNLDHDKKAMRWRAKDRLVQRIVDNVARRSTRGSAFSAI